MRSSWGVQCLAQGHFNMDECTALHHTSLTLLPPGVCVTSRLRGSIGCEVRSHNKTKITHLSFKNIFTYYFKLSANEHVNITHFVDFSKTFGDLICFHDFSRFSMTVRTLGEGSLQANENTKSLSYRWWKHDHDHHLLFMLIYPQHAPHMPFG